MSMQQDVHRAADRAAERLQAIEELAADDGPEWGAPYVPGSFGCHELLDRTSLVVDLIERNLLTHPACLQNADWHRLAAKAAEALHELYQQVGEAHLPAE